MKIDHRTCVETFTQNGYDFKKGTYWVRWVCPKHDVWWEEKVKKIDGPISEVEESDGRR
jgi:hypothetical protein